MPLPAITYCIPNFRRVHETLVAHGVDTTPLYRRLGVQDRDLTTESGSDVTVATYLELIKQAAEQLNNRFLGLAIGERRSDSSHLGLLGYMVSNAPNFLRCLDIIENYVGLIVPVARTGLVRDGGDYIWTYELEGFSPVQSTQDVEMSLMEFVGLARELLHEPEWRPERAYFQHSMPSDTGPMAALAGELHFDHYFNGVSFPEEFLTRALSDTDPHLLKVLEQQVQRSMQQLMREHSLLGRLQLLISSRLGKAEVTGEALARELGMSRRSFDRHLQALGTSLAMVRETIVAQIAKQTLCETDVSVTELAQQVGYSDASAFIRAFKRLTGFAPLAYRRAHGGHRLPRPSSAS